ncbi:MAG: zinc ABC transporter substrate-binding protein [Cyanobacteria bacterium KgW148]|nr:zinc ABC transporter substrate-binding protein [Cyanobacteria bacterium KgW148]
MRKILGWLTLPIVALTIFPAVAQTKKPKVVATFLPMYLFTKSVMGNQGQLEVLVPPGTGAHEYQATPANAKSLSQADVVVMNGLDFEEFMEGLLKNNSNKKVKVIDASKGITPLQDKDAKAEKHSHGHNHSHSGGNPHVWLDPVLAVQQVTNIRNGLVAADPANGETYKANATKMIDRLQELDRQFKTRLAPVKGCKFIAFHDAFPYLAKRYGLEQKAVVELPEDALKPQDIQRVKSAAQKFQVKALLSEPGVDDKRLQQIAKELKLPVKTLDPLESGKLDPDYYFQVMTQNLATLESVCK